MNNPKGVPDNYDVLHEADGWAYIREKEARITADERCNFILHYRCSGGGTSNIRYGGSVMHYKKRTCQACGLTPADEVLGAYLLHRWGDGVLIPICTGDGDECECC